MAISNTICRVFLNNGEKNNKVFPFWLKASIRVKVKGTASRPLYFQLLLWSSAAYVSSIRKRIVYPSLCRNSI